jgi:hypothetical protein
VSYRAPPNHVELEAAKLELQSVVKKPGGVTVEPGSWVTLRGGSGSDDLR